MNLNRNHLLTLATFGLIIAAIDHPPVAAQNSSLLYDAPPLARAIQPPFPGSKSQLPASAGSDANSVNVAPIPAGITGGDPRVMLNGASWTYQPAAPVRIFRENDIVTIRVDEVTRMMAEGESESRKQTLFEAVLSDWISLSDFRLRPDAQAAGDPSVAGESNSRFRSESSVESRESMSFNIAATIVDIRPNGSLVLEARKNIRVNDNLWETALTGICRPEDIAPDNVVLSRDLIDLEILKEDRGHLRDGYKRGWFSRWFDRVQPF
tara:strand:- start:54746 stop:55543 length:798 start_codon:yes stop_codon:yes gene_type:complete